MAADERDNRDENREWFLGTGLFLGGVGGDLSHWFFFFFFYLRYPRSSGANLPHPTVIPDLPKTGLRIDRTVKAISAG